MRLNKAIALCAACGCVCLLTRASADAPLAGGVPDWELSAPAAPWGAQHVTLLQALAKLADDFKTLPGAPLIVLEDERRDQAEILISEDGVSTPFMNPCLPVFSIKAGGRNYAQLLDEFCRLDGHVTWRLDARWNVIDVVSKDLNGPGWPLNRPLGVISPSRLSLDVARKVMSMHFAGGRNWIRKGGAEQIGLEEKTLGKLKDEIVWDPPAKASDTVRDLLFALVRAVDKARGDSPMAWNVHSDMFNDWSLGGMQAINEAQLQKIAKLRYDAVEEMTRSRGPFTTLPCNGSNEPWLKAAKLDPSRSGVMRIKD